MTIVGTVLCNNLDTSGSKSAVLTKGKKYSLKEENGNLQVGDEIKVDLGKGAEFIRLK